jgi:hypothetical protein
VQNTTLVDQNQWANEVRKADERCVEYQTILTELQAKLNHESKYTVELSQKIKVRDSEILRLHELYMPAQNLEKINIKYMYQQNEQNVTKL